MSYSFSLGAVAGIVDQASLKAANINAQYDLSTVRQSGADEVFHRREPILTAVDIPSRFCLLLAKEQQRDADSWAVHLLDLVDRQFQPETNISDQAAGLKKAFEQILPETELRFDHFHCIKASKELIRLMKNRKASATTQALTLYERREKARLAGKDYHALDGQMEQALETMNTAEILFERTDTLCSWLQYDVLQLPACAPADREMLFDFIVEELLTMIDQPRVQTFVRSLIHQKKDLLAVAHCLNDQYLQIAQRHGLAVEQIWAIGYTARFDIHAPTYHIRSEQLESRIGEHFDQIEDEVLMALANTHRCSSIVENFNSRLKPYIDPRKTITQKTLSLYQFILNHRPFQRSHHPHLVGKTPAEALTGKPHRHWLELLGYPRFKRPLLTA